MFRNALVALSILASTAIPSLVLAQTTATENPSIFVSHPTTVKADVMTMGPLPEKLQGKPVVVRIHADWCPACKATAATYDAVQKKFADRVTFVAFDVTDAKTAAASAERAKELGLGKIFDADKAATSTVAIVNPKTGVVATSLYNDNDPADYARAIAAVRAQLGSVK